MTDQPAVEPARLRRHLESLIGERSPVRREALSAAERYIADQFTAAGWSVERHAVRWMGERYHNLIATRPDALGPPLILGAHFDTVEGTPGADDNASGVAVLLETARLLALQPPRCAVTCAAFTLEEMNMIGSSHYAQALKRARARIIGMWSLEMLGYTCDAPNSQQLPRELRGRYPSTGNFLAVIGNRRSQGLLQQTVRGMQRVEGLRAEQLIVPLNGWMLPATRLSDHAPFWDAGFPALLLTDTAFLRNPHYHQPTDTLETLDLDFMSRVCAGIVSAAQAVSASAGPS